MIVRVKAEGKEIILVGTAHVSKKSVAQVTETIENENPDAVGVELDASRFRQLEQGPKWRETSVFDLIQKGQTYLFLLNLFLANMQKRIGAELGVKPGEEMLVAVRAAQKKRVPVGLLDRDVKVTLKRALHAASIWEKLRLGASLIAGLFAEGEAVTAERVEEMKKQDVMSELMAELSKKAPGIKRVLVDERDAYIAQSILAMRGKKIVAVVGAGHLTGIEAHLKEGKKEVRHLAQLPRQRKWLAKAVGIAIPLLFVAFLALGFANKGTEGLLGVVVYWILITGALSAVGALFARAHPKSVLVAFVAAPFTTLHPALASGWFAALAETRYRNPLVKDFDGLGNLNSYGDFQKNNVTHALIVAAYTNLGSTIGVLIALPTLLNLVL